MSRRISDDFTAFNNYVTNYNLSAYISSPQQIEACKAMHKKLFGLLVISAELSLQKECESSTPFLNETASDLLLSLFCVAQGMYKPAKLQLRCSIENFLKAVIMISRPEITDEKSVYAIFEIATNDEHFSTSFGKKCVESLHNDYAILCRTVHSDPNALNPTNALEYLPRYNPEILQEISTLFVRIVDTCSSILYLNFPKAVDKMHPDNKKDFLDSLTRTAKRNVVKTLFDD